jgi:hypothetical protein
MERLAEAQHRVEALLEKMPAPAAAPTVTDEAAQ